MTTTPVAASVQDNLSTVVAKLIGQKNETTTEANFNSASTNAKLNYLKSEMANLKTKVEVSGGVAKCMETGKIYSGSSKTFSGPGYILTHSAYAFDTLIVDGVVIQDKALYSNTNGFSIEFRESVVITTRSDSNINVYACDYVYYKY